MLDIAVQAIVAAMIAIIPPGKSVHSRMEIGFCDQECQQQKVCELPSILCDRPKFSPSVYNSLFNPGLQDYFGYRESITLQSYTVAENYETGLRRYVIIAQAVYETSREIVAKGIWPGSTEELEDSLITVFSFESGFRQDIHAGHGPLGLGDCEWRDAEGKRIKAWGKGRPVLKTCKSFCLGQNNLGKGKRFGYLGQDLVGTDLASTKRCADVSSRALAQYRGMCSRSSDRSNDWAYGMFAAYGTGYTCKPNQGKALWPAARAKRFRSLAGRVELKSRDREILELL